MRLSKQGVERLDKVIAELNLNGKRPEALRIAFAKGISETKGEPLERNTTGGWEIPERIIAVGEEYILYKHLIIERIAAPIYDHKMIDKYMLGYIEAGLEKMELEINELSDLDNYMLKLVQQAKS
ncbi:hypothetical protein AM501_20585 [Aneurinibacillus migulanus]|nr:hypothetical protein TS64_11375 [Aneurinibacillus migulanus]KPD06622.1 hypothetical protein AM501_20585 [Aneurinibacillus migulanus]